MFDEPTTIIVEGYAYVGDELDLRGNDFWGLALDQRAFGPQRLVVVTAGSNGAAIGLAHCERTEPPELALKCCLHTLNDGAAAVVAYSDEPVSADPPIGLGDRLDAARAAAREFGVHLVDWVMCDDDQMRSMRFTLEDCNPWWDAPDAGFPSATRPRRPDSRNRSPQRPRGAPRGAPRGVPRRRGGR
jgi:hypothetical protein